MLGKHQCVGNGNLVLRQVNFLNMKGKKVNEKLKSSSFISVEQK